jgi:23S rRNA (cytidine1920-2'-O)/16S rRNA (cytidine1409-2'-O)-methyltransferase
MPRRRLDAELVRRGLVRSRTEAEDLVRAGLVRVGGVPATKGTTLVATDVPVDLAAPRGRYVSRGGEKLAAALERSGVDPMGHVCLDAGASTGGFTDRLLQAGASSVVAVDVGYGQLDWKLRNDPRVTVRERTNVRDLRPEDVQPPPAVVVADLSFVSLRSVLDALVRVAAPEATMLLLVKPQFEVTPEDVGPGGVVREPRAWREALEGVVRTTRGLGLGVDGVMASPLPGPAGNVEFFVWGRLGGPDRAPDLARAIDEARAVR